LWRARRECGKRMAELMQSRVRWFLVFWLFILSAVAYLDRVNI
jgi:hypothetical protein